MWIQKMNAQFSTKAGIGKVGWGCLVLFLLPFCGFGIFAGIKAVQFFASGDWKQGLFRSLFAVVFGGVGFGLLIGARFGAKKQKEMDALKAAHPATPWMWRKDWAQGWIPSSEKNLLWAAWIFAVLWNLICFPIVFLLPKEVDKGNKLALIGFLFPLAGIGLLIWAIKTTSRWKKYGQSIFKMPRVPGVIGGQLSGVIEIPAKLRPQDGFQIQLSCVKRETTGSGDNRQTSERILWEDEKIIAKDLLENDLQRSAVPTFFEIPYSCSPSDADNLRNPIIWRLDAKANVPGGYHAQFEVPVFKTEQSVEEPVSTQDPTAAFQPPLESFAPDSTSRIKVQPNGTGSLKLIFPAALNPGIGIGMLVFTLIWTGSIWLMIFLKAPIIFPVVFGLFEFLLIYVLVELWFKSSKVTVDRTQISILKRWLFFKRERQILASDVEEIFLYAGMRSGDKAYYDIRVRERGGRATTAASGINPKQQADWFLQQIKAALAGKTV